MSWTSDANLKNNVEDVANAMDVINLLHPATYQFDVQGHPDMHLPSGLQRGLIAQEVEEVMPDLVQERVLPSYTDHAGVEHQGETVKSLNYIGLIPMLIAGMQEQQATIATLTERLADMEQVLSNCCSNENTGGDQRAAGAGGNMDVVSGDARALFIQPNPFSEQTTVYFTLERSGRMQLMANSADGKQLRVLHEAALEAGQYQHEWHTADLSPGVYYVTLLLDGEAIVKKAVKVQR